MADWRVSPGLALDEMVAERLARGESIVHLGVDEVRLPAFDPLVEHLVAGADRTSHGPVAGSRALREAAAGYFTRRRLPTGADQIVAGPGSKPLLLALNLVVPGDVIVPKPAWDTYAPQAGLAGKKVFRVPIPPQAGGVPDPVALRDTIIAARALGRDPRIVVLTLPDNPTGTLAAPDLVREICLIAEQEDLLIVSDEIHRDLLHDPGTRMAGPAEFAPSRTVVTTGLSKNLALGGWRVGVARFPDGAWGRRIRDGVIAFAGEVWSTVAGPVQRAAEYAFAEPPEIRRRLADSARLHGSVARAVHRIMVGAGAVCRPPVGAFHLYPDFSPVGDKLAARGVTDSASLSRQLLDEHGIVVLAGHLLGDDEDALRFKASMSTLYGDTAELRQLALDSPDPAGLPHVSDLLTRIGESFEKLCG
ncbi:pyridoxal phosphate-dependent aminotransferase [Kibdelosporangium phytohabitans]|uniref:Aminotransferase n=1 Tax=Kibdelosporangium phytohabitans TaxID=860235 RepID=A0A0N7F3M6_9PSEU|nr:pyridoxal phosphate-dependent aminotransferase [Kibdelosporangium phytohabitans]ALG09055.1 aminotransferase [Kibdelosporangium phytohabitans]MBE1469758.1 aspartate aminotransferase [Kibdelosporangium phytohabitans]